MSRLLPPFFLLLVLHVASAQQPYPWQQQQLPRVQQQHTSDPFFGQPSGCVPCVVQFCCCCCPSVPPVPQQPSLVPPWQSQNGQQLLNGGDQQPQQQSYFYSPNGGPFPYPSQYGQTPNQQQQYLPPPAGTSNNLPPSRQQGAFLGSPTASYSSPSPGPVQFPPRGSLSDPYGQTPNNEPGYLSNFRGDRYTDPQRETRGMNGPFFERTGGEPSYPGGDTLTPAQQLQQGPREERRRERDETEATHESTFSLLEGDTKRAKRIMDKEGRKKKRK